MICIIAIIAMERDAHSTPYNYHAYKTAITYHAIAFSSIASGYIESRFCPCLRLKNFFTCDTVLFVAFLDSERNPRCTVKKHYMSY